MNWKAIKQIYICVLVQNRKIEYLGEDKYAITAYYQSGEKHWRSEFKNRILHGKGEAWFIDGSKFFINEYINGVRQ